MSVCPCGGVTIPAKEKKLNAVLRYSRCGACGRCGAWELHMCGQRLCRGELARRAFNDDHLIEQMFRHRRKAS